MLKRGLAFCLVLSVASVARAGATIDMKPATGGGALTGVHNDAGNTVCYQLGTPSAFGLIDVFIQQTPAGTARELRHMQLDFSASTLCPSTSACSNALFLVPQPTHGSDRFWYFGGGAGSVAEPTCASDGDATCGDGHFFDANFTQPAGREKVVSATWYFATPTDLNGDATYQRTLLASAAQKIGQLRVELPTVAGNYTLDAINAAQANPDLGGADFRFGFGVDVVGGDGVALTTWRANPGNNITGSPLTIQMAVTCGVTGACCVGGNNCVLGQTPAQCTAQSGQYQGDNTTQCVNCPPPGGVTLVSSTPPCGEALPRAQKNIFRLTFSGPITTPPSAANINIRPLLAAGAYGANISANFTYALESGNTVVRIQEIGDNMTNQTWYGVTPNNWAGVGDFKRDYVKHKGNVNNDNFTNFADLSAVNSQIPAPGPIESKYNINADNFVNFADISAANSFIATAGTKPAKPTGHTCSIP